MNSLKQEYRQFLKDNFKGLRLGKGLFYCWKFGIRFNLQTGSTSNSIRKIVDENGKIIPQIGDTDTEEYFDEVVKRASTLFKHVFDDSDKTFFILMEYKHNRRKIRFSNFLFKQISNLRRNEVVYSKEYYMYDLHDNLDIRNVAIAKLPVDRINYHFILKAIANTDFEIRQPRLDNAGVFTSKEIYIINIDKGIIFSMYDDRGLDIIAKNRSSLESIYQVHNDWILEYDRPRIDNMFLKPIFPIKKHAQERVFCFI